MNCNSNPFQFLELVRIGIGAYLVVHLYGIKHGAQYRCVNIYGITYVLNSAREKGLDISSNMHGRILSFCVRDQT